MKNNSLNSVANQVASVLKLCSLKIKLCVDEKLSSSICGRGLDSRAHLAPCFAAASRPQGSGAKKKIAVESDCSKATTI